MAGPVVTGKRIIIAKARAACCVWRITEVTVVLGGQEQHIHRTAVDSSRIVAIRTDGQIRHSVPVQVSQTSDGTGETIVINQRRATARAVPDLPDILYGAVDVHQENVQFAAVGHSRSIVPRTDGKIRHSVGVQVRLVT